MTDYLIYIIKSTVYLSVFYAFVILVIRKTTFFRFNRIVFIVSTALCLVLPVLHLPLPQMPAASMPMRAIEEALAPSVASVGDSDKESLLTAVSAVYLIGAMVVIAGLAISFIRMRLHMDKLSTRTIAGINIKLSDVDMPSFSWGKVIMISRKDFYENPAILTHEIMHVRCLHSIDLMAYAIIMVTHWFNPLVWIARKELKMLHEYEVDNLTIDAGVDSYQYQMLLIKKAVGEKRFQMANGFNHSTLKNRIDMMHQARTNKWMRCAYILFIPILMGAMCCCDQNSLTDKDLRFEYIDRADFQKPLFDGGDVTKFSRWVNTNLDYPARCIEERIQGRVTLLFTVNEVGKVCDVKVIKGVCKELDEEAMRVVNESPLWTPGRTEDGTAVPVTFTFPIIFMLREP